MLLIIKFGSFIKLLDYEPRATLQVPMLLRLGQDKVALVKAIESGNTDLVYTVLLHLRENMPLGKFQVSGVISVCPFNLTHTNNG